MTGKGIDMSTIATARLVLERATKGAVLYKNANTDDGQPITTLYLRKSGLTEPYPAEIVVTIVKKDDEG